MVNPEKRRIAKRLIEQFLACEITNDEFNDAFPRDKDDPALAAIYSNLWAYYEDRHTHRLNGKHTLQSKAKELFERCSVFLSAGLEYEWPPYDWVSPMHAFMRLFRLSSKIDDKFARFKSSGNFEVWPFLREADFRRALASR